MTGTQVHKYCLVAIGMGHRCTSTHIMTLINDSLSSWVTKKNLVSSSLLDLERPDKDGCCWFLLLYIISNIRFLFLSVWFEELHTHTTFTNDHSQMCYIIWNPTQTKTKWTKQNTTHAHVINKRGRHVCLIHNKYLSIIYLPLAFWIEFIERFWRLRANAYRTVTLLNDLDTVAQVPTELSRCTSIHWTILETTCECI